MPTAMAIHLPWSGGLAGGFEDLGRSGGGGLEKGTGVGWEIGGIRSEAVSMGCPTSERRAATAAGEIGEA